MEYSVSNFVEVFCRQDSPPTLKRRKALTLLWKEECSYSEKKRRTGGTYFALTLSFGQPWYNTESGDIRLH
jgi:hypothetical protein